VVFVRGSGASFRDDDLSDELWEEIHWSPPSAVPATSSSGSGTAAPTGGWRGPPGPPTASASGSWTTIPTPSLTACPRRS
jgi:hypothetical protein